LIIDIDDTKKRISLFDFIKLQLGIENALNKKVDLVFFIKDEYRSGYPGVLN
jgi:hypothetical protein